MVPLVTGKPKLKPTGGRQSEGAFFPRPFGLRIWMALGTMAALFGGGQAKAVTYTWDGDGGNVNWSTIGNWAEGVAPIGATTTDIIFAGTNNTGTAGTPLNQDIINPLVLNSLTFSSGGGAFFLGGNALEFAGVSKTITQNSSSAESIANNISPSVNGTTTVTLAGSGTGLVTLSGIISKGTNFRDYAILKTGASTFFLTGVNTYSGGTTINGGTIAINSAASLGATGGALTINAGTLEVTTGFSTSRAITLGNAASTFLIDPGFTYTATGIISGAGTLNKTGTGTMVLGGNNTFSGGTNISAGTLQINASDRLLNTGALTLSGGTFNLVTFSETVGLVTLVSGSITGTGSATLTGSSYVLQSGTVSAILGGIAALTKSTSGTVTLSGVNTFTGSATVNDGILIAAATSGSALGSASSIAINSDGTLSLGANNQINNTVTMTLAGGTFAKGDFSEGSTSAAGVGTLTLTGSNSHLDFGIGAVGTLSFASFAPGTETLLIDSWTGTANTIGTASIDRLVFAADQTGNLSNFWFTGYESGASQFALGGGYFEVVPFAPVPEPSANYLLAIAALAAVAWSQRRRWRCFLFRGGP